MAAGGLIGLLASAVLLIERVPQTETGGVSLDGPACDKASNLACNVEGTPVRVAKRNVAAGDVFVMEDNAHDTTIASIFAHEAVVYRG